MKMLGYNTGNPDTRSFDCQDLVAKKFLSEEDHVLIIDDFLAQRDWIYCYL